jgi:hypothetical protein
MNYPAMGEISFVLQFTYHRFTFYDLWFGLIVFKFLSREFLALAITLCPIVSFYTLW